MKKWSQVLSSLVIAINQAGLTELVRGNHAYETVCRIIDTGRDLGFSGDHFDADTEESARGFSNPSLWGIPGEAWMSFCEEWAMA